MSLIKDLFIHTQNRKSERKSVIFLWNFLLLLRHSRSWTIFIANVVSMCFSFRTISCFLILMCFKKMCRNGKTSCRRKCILSSLHNCCSVLFFSLGFISSLLRIKFLTYRNRHGCHALHTIICIFFFLSVAI